MNRQQILDAADATLALGFFYAAESDTPSLDYDHLVEMREKMGDPEFSMGKLNRWLGWMQAAVVGMAYGEITLDQMKAINTPKEQPG